MGVLFPGNVIVSADKLIGSIWDDADLDIKVRKNPVLNKRPK